MWNMRFLAENVGCPYVFPSICEVYGQYQKEGFLNWLLHVRGRRSTTGEQRNYGEVITKKLTLIFSAPAQRLLSGRLGCLRMNGMKLDIYHRGLAWGRSRVTQRCEALFCVRNSTIFSW